MSKGALFDFHLGLLGTKRHKFLLTISPMVFFHNFVDSYNYNNVRTDDVFKVIDKLDVLSRDTPLHVAIHLSGGNAMEMLMSAGAN